MKRDYLFEFLDNDLKSVMMMNCKFSLEDLPNELLIDIMKNLDTRTVFRAFANLNYRFNHLLRLFDCFQFYLHIHPSNLFKSTDDFLSASIYTLVVNPWMNVNLLPFINLRRLRLDRPLPKVLEQVTHTSMPFLEHLSIIYMHNMYEMDLLRDRIFSNRFSHLKSCELLGEKSPISIRTWSESPSIEFLHIQSLDFPAYQLILLACPNLIYLKFSMHSPASSIITNRPFIHSNLQQLIINYNEFDWHRLDETILSEYLAYVPNLSRLCIERKIHCQNFDEHFHGYDWLASILRLRLGRLRKFQYILYIVNDTQTRDEIYQRTIRKFQDIFHQLHPTTYRACLTVI